MYVADSRGVTEARGALRPGSRAAAIAPVVFALGAVSLITDVSSEMITAVRRTGRRPHGARACAPRRATR